ncbi:MAG: hypothetical protein AB3N18_13710 [Allomuricauda sp.]
MTFDEDTSTHIRRLILKYGIKEISFVLSITNPIIIDALENQDFADIRGLSDFYHEVLRQKGYSEVLCGDHKRQFIILSYHLNKKIRELQLVLNGLDMGRLKIGGKIYNNQEKAFNEIYSDLVCTEYFSLN